MRELKPLDDLELETAYNTVLREAFPPQELKPLSAIRRMTKQGVYRPLGFFQDGTPLGYIFLLTDEPYILIDYLCVPKTRRNGGIGGALIKAALRAFPSDTVFIGEVEAPTGDPGRDSMILRRLDFYRRCGAVTLGYDTALFGVHYKTIVWSGAPVDEQEVMHRHADMYRSRLNPKLYAAAVHIPLIDGEEVPAFDEWTE